MDPSDAAVRVYLQLNSQEQQQPVLTDPYCELEEISCTLNFGSRAEDVPKEEVGSPKSPSDNTEAPSTEYEYILEETEPVLTDDKAREAEAETDRQARMAEASEFLDRLSHCLKDALEAGGEKPAQASRGPKPPATAPPTRLLKEALPVPPPVPPSMPSTSSSSTSRGDERPRGEKRPFPWPENPHMSNRQQWFSHYGYRRSRGGRFRDWYEQKYDRPGPY